MGPGQGEKTAGNRTASTAPATLTPSPQLGIIIAQPGKAAMQKIDIDSLTEQELTELNHKIVARLRFLNQMRSHSDMMGFRIGEKVRFRPSGQAEVTGTLTRYNKKTVTVITEDGEHWNVSPSFLSKVEPRGENNAKPTNSGVVPFLDRSAKK